VNFHDLLDEAEPQSGSVNLILHGPRAPEKRIEDVFLLVRRNSGSQSLTRISIPAGCSPAAFEAKMPMQLLPCFDPLPDPYTPYFAALHKRYPIRNRRCYPGGCDEYGYEF
jgi:hypothetical protein